MSSLPGQGQRPCGGPGAAPPAGRRKPAGQNQPGHATRQGESRKGTDQKQNQPGNATRQGESRKGTPKNIIQKRQYAERKSVLPSFYICIQNPVETVWTARGQAVQTLLKDFQALLFPSPGFPHHFEQPTWTTVRICAFWKFLEKLLKTFLSTLHCVKFLSVRF